MCADVCSGGRGASSTQPVSSLVSQKGCKDFTANSLHSSVSEHSAHIRRLHGRKHNLFDATLPTRAEPSSSHWRFTVFNFHFIFCADRQAGAGSGLHLDVNQHFNTKCKRERVNTGALTLCFQIFVFVDSGMCN